MAFENCADSFARAVAEPVKKAGRVIDGINGLYSQEERMLAAQKGGYDGYGSAADIKAAREAGVKGKQGEGAAAVDGIRNALDGFVDGVFTFDPAEVSAVAPAVAVCASDDDYRRVAQGCRDSLGGLKAVAAADNPFCQALARSLGNYEKTVSAACQKAGDFAARGMARLSDTKKGSDLEFLVDLQREKIEKAWGDLQDTIDGNPNESPMMAAFLAAGFRRA